MNPTSANSLLKILEEPQGELRFVLASESAAALLPTIRSRCQSHLLQWPPTDEATAWLVGQGMPELSAAVWLAACGGRAFDAASFAQAAPQLWQDLPHRMQNGQTEPLDELFGVDPAQWVHTLQKLCHDLLAVKNGASPRFFAAENLPNAQNAPGLASLIRWGSQLHEHARQASHPLNASLLLELLGAQALAAMRHP